MKKQLLTLLISLLAYSAYSQILFEKGYYINNTGEKIEGLIKNIDWKNSPLDIEFKLSEETESKNITINDISEFGIYNICKYKRYTIDIDRSSEFINNISLVKNPEFKEETLFLKVLIEGKASLLQYSYQSLTRYFYNVDDSDVKQLVYKSYKNDNNEIVKNNEYKQQLFNSLKCEEISMRNLQYLDYNQKDLFNLFKKYNTCNNSEIKVYNKKKTKKDLINLTIRPGIVFSSLEINTPSETSYNFNFSDKTYYKMGIEAEIMLPFHNNKWSFIIEPTFYTNYYTEAYSFRGRLRMSMDYKSFQIPIGFRHYIYLNNDSKIFLNALLAFDFVNKKSNILFEEGKFHLESMQYTFDDPILIKEMGIVNSSSFGIGLGYQYKNKYSVEVKFYPSKKIIQKSNSWDTKFNSTSITLGYTIF